MKPHALVAIVSAALASGTALAAQAALPPGAVSPPGITVDPGEAKASRKRADNRKNPDDIICKREGEIGTRLPRKKVCMTRAQMLQRRQHDRDWIERSQVNRPDSEQARRCGLAC